jgi:chromate transporter
LPGPASSQVGFAIGLLKGGLRGGLAAWTGFTLPSAALMVAFAFAQNFLIGPHARTLSHALQLVAVAVVAQAVLMMQRTLAPDRLRTSIAVLGACLALLLPGNFNTLLAILCGALAGLIFCSHSAPRPATASSLTPLSKPAATAALTLFALLLLLSVLAPARQPANLRLFSTFYRSGALVFGGGHVVLPLLESATVGPSAGPNSVPESVFLAGYGAAQAIPGPLFTFAAYLGAVMRGLAGASLALAGISLPGLLLMAGVLPHWGQLRSRTLVRAALTGVNSSVVGVLAAALYRPVWTAAVHGALDLTLALVAFVLLVQWRARPWIIVVGAAIASQLFFV